MPTPEESIWPRILGLARGEGLNPESLPPSLRSAWTLYATVAGAQGSFVIAQLGQSLDGRIATPTGHSHYVNGPHAITHLHRLRALVDAVIVGVNTVIADDPKLTVRLVDGKSPARVIIDPSGRLPADAQVLADDGIERIVVHASAHNLPAGVTGITLESHDRQIAPAAILNALAARGLRKVLIEGGSRTVSCFLAARALDRLHVTVAPVIIGSGTTGMCLPEIDHLDDALRPAVSVHRFDEDVLFDCAFARTP